MVGWLRGRVAGWPGELGVRVAGCLCVVEYPVAGWPGAHVNCNALKNANRPNKSPKIRHANKKIEQEMTRRRRKKFTEKKN